MHLDNNLHHLYIIFNYLRISKSIRKLQGLSYVPSQICAPPEVHVGKVLTFAPPSPSPNIPSYYPHGNRTPARRLPAPRDAERPHRPGGDAGPGPERQPPPAAVQDPFYRRHPLGRPQPAGLQLRTILEETQHTILNVEHQTNERARVTAGCVTLALKLASARCLRSR